MADDMTNETLITAYMHATGCTEDDAMEVLGMACSGAYVPPEVLPRIVPVLAMEMEMHPTMVLTVLAGLYRLGLGQNGNELLFKAGFEAAKRGGVAAELVEKLQALVRGPERGH